MERLGNDAQMNIIAFLGEPDPDLPSTVPTRFSRLMELSYICSGWKRIYEYWYDSECPIELHH